MLLPKLSNLALWAAVFAPFAAAKVAFTNSDYSGITAGKPFVLTWNGDAPVCTLNHSLLHQPKTQQPVTITLASGPAENLKTVAVLTSKCTSSLALTDHQRHPLSTNAPRRLRPRPLLHLHPASNPPLRHVRLHNNATWPNKLLANVLHRWSGPYHPRPPYPNNRHQAPNSACHLGI